MNKLEKFKQINSITINIDFGEWEKSNKMLVGAPDYAEKIDSIKQEHSHKHPKVWFTSDTHFGSQRTLELSRRPFSSVQEMDWAMAAKWIAVVGPNDTVYHLGDFGNFSMIQHLIYGQLYLIPENSHTLDDAYNAEKHYKNVKVLPSGSHVFIKNKMFYMIHKPEQGDGISGKFYLFGYIHELQKVKRDGLNVGVDCHNFAPVSEDTVLFYHNAITQHYDNNVFMKNCGEE